MLNPADIEVYRKTTLDDLINDAVERKDKKALLWLQTESAKKVDRVKSDGTIVKVNQTLPHIRADYAKKFLHYTNRSKASAEIQRKRKAEKKEKERQEKFAKAFALLEDVTE